MSKGAKCLRGGQRHELGGNFFQPTVLSDVTRDMIICSQETFGPVAPLIRCVNVFSIRCVKCIFHKVCKMYFFAEFPSCVTEKPAYAGSVILDCMLSLDSGLITDNSAL